MFGVLAEVVGQIGPAATDADHDTLALADEAVSVPIYGQAESMNLATAASVCLYESAFAQRSAIPQSGSSDTNT